MKGKQTNYIRRRLMFWMPACSLLGPAVIPPWLRKVLAMGQKDFPQGMQTVEGEVSINGRQAEIGSLVNVGDVVATGEDGYAVFVMQHSAYVVRENSRITDEELILLESLVGRRPPFLKKPGVSKRVFGLLEAIPKLSFGPISALVLVSTPRNTPTVCLWVETRIRLDLEPKS